MKYPIYFAQIEEGDSTAQHGAAGRKATANHSPSGSNNPEGQSLFAAHKTIHVREVKGKFNNLRWLFVWLTQLFYFVTPWLMWNGRPAVWLDLQKRFFYIFGWTFSPTDIVYMTLVLIICALALFLFTTVAGRLWCGYTCPQTVYTEIFMWIERKVEGNRAARIRLEKAPMSASKLIKKIIKHALWIAVSLAASFTLVAYFTGAEGTNNGMQLLREIANHETSFAQVFWIGLYGFMMYLFAGFMREQVCLYMCPYARFQSVMFDPDTLIVTYDEARGESRGPRKKGVDPRSIGKGDCIDCGVCVDVCPTGIDIRNGLQYECIGCGACIDACNEIMDKMGYERGLVRYDTENGVKNKFTQQQLVKRTLRPRVLVYSAILMVLFIALFVGIGQRTKIRMVVERDKRTIAVNTEEGLVENVYTLQLSNTDEKVHTVIISASGIDGIKIVGKSEVELDPASTDTKIVRVRVDPQKAKAAGVGADGTPIVFHLKSPETGEDLEYKSIYYLPKE
jgi:cytochrome c oxidase accessory protein FixG